MTSALILAAGKATRLEGIRDTYAKANVPVGNTTPLRFMLERLDAAGIDEAWINLHYLADQVRRESARWASAGMKVHFIHEETLLGTGGTLLEMVKRSGRLPDVVVNAKMFTDFDFGSICSSATPKRQSALVLHPSSRLTDFGGLSFDREGLVTGLHPRNSPAPASPSGAAVFTGIARPDEAWLPFLDEASASCDGNPVCSIRHGLLPALAAGTSTATAVLHRGYWKEISTPERVAEIRAEFPELLRS